MYFAGDKAKELPRQQRRGGSSTQIVCARDVKNLSMNKKYQKEYQRIELKQQKHFPSAEEISEI